MLFGKKKSKPSGDENGEYRGPFTVWGGNLHPGRLGPHFVLIGQNGSGKTLAIRLLMRSALAPGGELRHRVMVYDPKLDFYPILRGMGIPESKIHILNPFDVRSEAWNIAADIKTSAAAREFAGHLLPQEKGEHPYFANTPRALVAELLDTLRTRAGTKWTLNDLVQLIMTWKFVEALERSGPRGQAAVKGHITLLRGCVPQLVATFLDTASVDAVDPSCVGRLSRPPFFTSYTGPEPTR